MTTINFDEMKDSLITDDSPMARFKRLLGQKHAKTVTGGRCDEYYLTYNEETAKNCVTLSCESCGVVLHRIYREDGDGD